jgi:hypothetical protein
MSTLTIGFVSAVLIAFALAACGGTPESSDSAGEQAAYTGDATPPANVDAIIGEDCKASGGKVDNGTLELTGRAQFVVFNGGKTPIALAPNSAIDGDVHLISPGKTATMKTQNTTYHCAKADAAQVSSFFVDVKGSTCGSQNGNCG